ncbi:hypothetical protein [Absidia glauca]|uniref:Uncharacterized protein n=1 Tax=Absidia glauca TaxID=4829 RepID=A0A168MK37_ABSGL|nr:hypothetical protein [Absidia glauca]
MTDNNPNNLNELDPFEEMEMDIDLDEQPGLIEEDDFAYLHENEEPPQPADPSVDAYLVYKDKYDDLVKELLVAVREDNKKREMAIRKELPGVVSGKTKPLIKERSDKRESTTE